MSNKYRLIKTYPGSPELGTIVYKQIKDNCTFYTYIKNSSLKFVSHSYIEYPEFWEEVVEKDYEILSLIFNKFDHLIEKNTILTANNNELEKLLKNSSWDIHSVKRLNDGEIFIVGDKIKGYKADNNPFEIKYIFINHFNKLVFATYPKNTLDPSYNDRSCYLRENIPIKVKQSLLTTEDGIDIFEGDKFYYIGNSFNICEINCLYKENGYFSKFKTFSTKEKADKYILMNKPCLSYNDVRNMSQFSAVGKSINLTNSINFKKLKDLVTSKIQQSV